MPSRTTSMQEGEDDEDIPLRYLALSHDHEHNN
jgi:hypothetical protein